LGTTELGRLADELLRLATVDAGSSAPPPDEGDARQAGPDRPAGEPVSVDIAATDFVKGADVERDQFLVGSPQLAFDLDGARNLT